MEPSNGRVGHPEGFERHLGRTRLRFEPELEAAYRDDYFERWRGTNRFALVVGLVTYAVFGIVDVWATPRSLGSVWMLRYGIGCSTAVITLMLTYRASWRRLMQPVTALTVFVLSATIVGMEVVVHRGEIGYQLYVFGLAPVTAFGYAGPRLRFVYATVSGWSALLVALLVGADHQVWATERTAVRFGVMLALLAAVNVAGMIGAYLMETGSRRGFIQDRIVRRERERSETLLLNALPASVAERLKRGEPVAEGFDDASVLFADLVGFTPLAQRLRPAELMALLNRIFSRFDELADRHGLEKIKTMGDCYMVVGGIPEARPDHLERIADMALDMLGALDGIRVRPEVPLQLRVGIAAGPVVAGVIGTRKFSYDLWGDTVNTASRMESHGVPGGIRVTAQVFERLCGRYRFEGPEAVQVKGKGEMRTYLLLGRAGDRPEVQS